MTTDELIAMLKRYPGEGVRFFDQEDYMYFDQIEVKHVDDLAAMEDDTASWVEIVGVSSIHD